MYFHKLNLYLNQATTIQSFIIHLIYKDTGLFTSGIFVIELDLELCTCHIPSIYFDQLIFETLDTVCPDLFLFQTSSIISICIRLIHMSYSDQLILQTSDMAIWTSFNSSLIDILHLCESNVPVESGYLLRKIKSPNDAHPNNLSTSITFVEDTMSRSHTTHHS